MPRQNRHLLKDVPANRLFTDTIMSGMFRQADYLGERERFFAPMMAVSPDAARARMIDFTRYTFAGFRENWHHRVLADFLDRFAAGKIPRAMVFLPPRHSKSEFVSRRLPAKIFGTRPDAKIINASYGFDLAGQMSASVQRIMESPAYQGLFPETRLDGKQTDAFFEVNNGAGYYRAAGIGGGITGMGASYAIIDDPIKDFAQAMSTTYRDLVWNWYQSTLYTRLEQPGAILLTMTRWHEDDLAGRLLKQAKDDPESDQWTVLRLAARATRPEPNRAVGEPLWPTEFDDAKLRGIQKATGHWWEALYQQRPTAPGGTVFQREWFTIVQVMPVAPMKRCRYWDVAGTEREKGGRDWTVGTLIAEHPSKHWIIEDVVRGQWDSGDVETIIKQTADADAARYGARAVRIREEQEPGSSGKDVIRMRRKLLAGYDYDGIVSTGEKQLRWTGLAAQAKGGNVFLLAGPWNADWLDEITRVPKHADDDQADSAAGAFNELALGKGKKGLVLADVIGY